MRGSLSCSRSLLSALGGSEAANSLYPRAVCVCPVFLSLVMVDQGSRARIEGGSADERPRVGSIGDEGCGLSLASVCWAERCV